MKNLYLLLIVSFLVSCVPKQYGRYFNHRPYDTQMESSIKTDSIPQLELIASTTNMTALELTEETEVGSQPIDPSSSKVNLEKMAQENILLDSIDRTSETVLPIANKKTDERKIEPLGVIALAMMLLVPFVATNIIAPILIVGGLTLAIISLVKIKRNKLLWMGKGFGIATIVLLAIYLLLLGLIIYALSSAF